jgi:hypothetical protein
MIINILNQTIRAEVDCIMNMCHCVFIIVLQDFAIDKKTGKESWRKEVGEVISAPYVYDNTAYFWIKEKGPLAFDLRKSKSFGKPLIIKSNLSPN